MVRFGVALLMLFTGMAPAISCENSSDDVSAQVTAIDLGCSKAGAASSLAASQENPTSDQDDSKSLPCAFCSSFCHHAVILFPQSALMPILALVSFFGFPTNSYSSIDLDSPKEPPRFS